MTIVVNAAFVRTFRAERSGRKVTESRSIQGIVLQHDWEADHVEIRRELLARLPANEGWTIQGYCLVGAA